jgi:hypothetical protein
MKYLTVFLFLFILFPCVSQESSDNFWAIEHFIDDFGDPTDVAYITNSGNIEGTQTGESILGTVNQKAYLRLLVLNENEVQIFIYQYGTRYDFTVLQYAPSANYRIILQDSERKQYTFRPQIYSDRLLLNEADSETFNNLLINGENIRLAMYLNPFYTDMRFNFEITSQMTSSYENIYRGL